MSDHDRRPDVRNGRPRGSLRIRSRSSDVDDRRRQASYQTQRLENSEHEVMVNCCLGAYPEVWYKFKRFECLSLLNLYYYQHELVSLDEEIFGTPNATHEWKPLDSTELLNLRTVIKEYQSAIKLFKETSQMKRPIRQEREDTVTILAEKLAEPHYLEGHDALRMLDLSPGALQTTQDRLRAMIEKGVNRRDASRRVYSSAPGREAIAYRSEDQTQYDKKNYLFFGRPFALPADPKIDHLIQFVIGVVAAASLLTPLIVLSKIRERDYTIMASCLFVLVFAFVVSIVGGQSTAQVMVAVATYAAVLVVFVGQTISAPP